MLALLKLLQRFVKTLHSEGTPAQIAAGMAMGAALGLTPLVNVHNLIILGLLIILNVSFAAGLLAAAAFGPIGFLLDPLFDRIGAGLLLRTPALEPLWLRLDNIPGFPYTNFNNTVVLGSLVAWGVLAIPIYFAARFGVLRYRAGLGSRIEQTRIVKLLKASRAYNVYRWFRAE
jgi:uncharacterized protein (TIGR03546 family)